MAVRHNTIIAYEDTASQNGTLRNAVTEVLRNLATITTARIVSHILEVIVPDNAGVSDLTAIMMAARDAFIGVRAVELVIKYGPAVLGTLDINDPTRILKVQIHGGLPNYAHAKTDAALSGI